MEFHAPNTDPSDAEATQRAAQPAERTRPAPPARLGQCLARARVAAGLSQRKAARALRVRHSALRAWESGAAAPDASQLERAIRLYSTDLDEIWPDRESILSDDEPGVLLIGDERIDIAQPNRTVLAQYLAAVRRQRGIRPDGPIELRSTDLGQLARALDLDDRDLEATLADLLGLTPAGAKLTSRALAVGVLTAVATTALTATSWIAPGSGGVGGAHAAGPTPEAADASPFSTDAAPGSELAFSATTLSGTAHPQHAAAPPPVRRGGVSGLF